MNPFFGRNNGNPHPRDEIDELRGKIAALINMVQILQAPTDGSDPSEDTQTHFENPFVALQGL